MTSPLCPHGLTAADCLICATLTTGAAEAGGEHLDPAWRGRARPRSGAAAVVVALVALVLAGWWALAVLSLVLRLAELMAVAVVGGWVGWRLGVRHGRRAGRT